MKDSDAINRRRFLQAGMLAAATTSILAQTGCATGKNDAAREQAAVPPDKRGFATKPVRDPFNGLKVGIASYTYRKFTLDQAIAMTKQAGLKYINLKDMHLPLKSTVQQRQEARQKVEMAGLTLMGGGVIALSAKEPEIRAAFDYCKDAGMPTMVCTLNPDALDIVETVAKGYEIKVAIHNHGPGDKHFPSPHDVYRAVKARDARLGLCMDIGHTVRIGEDPVLALQECGSRIYDLHIKDETAPKAEGKPTEVGEGVIDIARLLKALVKCKFPYHLGLEYEAKEAAPQPGVLESVAYMRGILATT